MSMCECVSGRISCQRVGVIAVVELSPDQTDIVNDIVLFFIFPATQPHLPTYLISYYTFIWRYLHCAINL